MQKFNRTLKEEKVDLNIVKRNSSSSTDSQKRFGNFMSLKRKLHPIQITRISKKRRFEAINQLSPVQLSPKKSAVLLSSPPKSSSQQNMLGSKS